MSLTAIEKGWAAGFFDGEGCITLHAEGKKRKDGTRRKYPRLAIRSTDLDMLVRFSRAVGKYGSISGPYIRKSPTGNQCKPSWDWAASNKSADATMRLLYRHLSKRRRKRIKEVWGANFRQWGYSGQRYQ